MIDYIFKYGTGDLIIIYYCVYSRLLGTMIDVIWNSIKLMRNIGSSPQINR